MSRSSTLPVSEGKSWLPYGNGRSYGDSCLNPGQGVLDCRGLDKYIAWDPETGDFTCEGGVLLSEILRFALPRGWFLPVTPGTQWVTVGGAIANDVHGKNHHACGSFGCHVRSAELLRSDGSRKFISRDRNSELFAGTIGGLGLTGVITQATIRLKRVPGPWLLETKKRFRSLAEFFDVDREFKHEREYTVAWIDCVAPKRARGRGIYMAADHFVTDLADKKPGALMHMLFHPPCSLVNPLTLRAFNFAYYNRPLKAEAHPVHYRPFFYPLDSVLEWNRIYGPKGLYQFQCVIPRGPSREAVAALLELISAHRAGSFLAVMKSFGDKPSDGILSFPRAGITLSLDFPNRGESTRRLFAELEAAVMDFGGTLYPAKDALMTPGGFRASYPKWEKMRPHIDPHFSSAFWRRVTDG